LLFGQDAGTVREIRTSLDVLARSLNDRGFEPLSSRLADQFSFGDLGVGVEISIKILRNLVSDYFQKARIKTIDIDVIVPEGSDYRVQTVFHYERPRKYEDARQDFLMTGDGKFLSIEIPYIRVTIGTDDSESQ
jgi:hypothetical protein